MDDATLIERRYVIRRCPECHGQATEMGSRHFTDCPNTYAAFVPEEAEVTWPNNSRGAVSLIGEARYCVTAALNCPAHPWHGSDKARKWLIEAARLGGQ